MQYDSCVQQKECKIVYLRRYKYTEEKVNDIYKQKAVMCNDSC